MDLDHLLDPKDDYFNCTKLLEGVDLPGIISISDSSEQAWEPSICSKEKYYNEIVFETEEDPHNLDDLLFLSKNHC